MINEDAGSDSAGDGRKVEMMFMKKWMKILLVLVCLLQGFEVFAEESAVSKQDVVNERSTAINTVQDLMETLSKAESVFKSAGVEINDFSSLFKFDWWIPTPDTVSTLSTLLSLLPDTSSSDPSLKPILDLINNHSWKPVEEVNQSRSNDEVVDRINKNKLKIQALDAEIEATRADTEAIRADTEATNDRIKTHEKFQRAVKNIK